MHNFDDEWTAIQCAFVDMISQGFTDNEIEMLEDMADWYFTKLEQGKDIDLPPRLVLDVLREYEAGGTE